GRSYSAVLLDRDHGGVARPPEIDDVARDGICRLRVVLAPVVGVVEHVSQKRNVDRVAPADHPATSLGGGRRRAAGGGGGRAGAVALLLGAWRLLRGLALCACRVWP